VQRRVELTVLTPLVRELLSTRHRGRSGATHHCLEAAIQLPPGLILPEQLSCARAALVCPSSSRVPATTVRDMAEYRPTKPNSTDRQVLGHGVSGVECRYNLLDHPISISARLIHVPDVYCDQLEQISTRASTRSVARQHERCCTSCRTTARGLSRGVGPPRGVLPAVTGVAIPGVAAKLASNEPGRPLIGGTGGGLHAI
jgi:hypothetical protein